MKAMKKLIASVFIFLLVFTGCVPKPQEEILQPTENNEDQEISIVPSYQLSEDNYKMILPYRPSQARGAITNQIGNRVDIYEMEAGLRRHSTEVFDPNVYYFEEGQYISKDMVFDWIDTFNPEGGRYRTEEEHTENPRYLSHILEQNFLERQEDDTVELAGVSIGIALKSVYRFQTEIGGPYFTRDISDEEIQEQGREIAQLVLERLRAIEGLQDVPIMIALYREEEVSSPVPGNYFEKTVVPSGDMLIGEWEPIDEKYVLFPSQEAQSNHPDEYNLLDDFGEMVATYFPNYVGYVGEGLYINGNLQQLTIKVPIEFYGEAEVIGFTQYVYGIINGFPKSYDIEVVIESRDQIESFIYREAGDDEPYFHIFN